MTSEADKRAERAQASPAPHASAPTPLSDELRVTTCDGKYTVVLPANGKLHALRYGQPWRDCIGDGLILSLAQEIETLNGRLAQCAALVATRREMEEDKIRWAKFIVRFSFPEDHACKECYPEGHMVREGFKCVPHTAAEALKDYGQIKE